MESRIASHEPQVREWSPSGICSPVGWAPLVTSFQPTERGRRDRMWWLPAAGDGASLPTFTASVVLNMLSALLTLKKLATKLWTL